MLRIQIGEKVCNKWKKDKVEELLEKREEKYWGMVDMGDGTTIEDILAMFDENGNRIKESDQLIEELEEMKYHIWKCNSIFQITDGSGFKLGRA